MTPATPDLKRTAETAFGQDADCPVTTKKQKKTLTKSHSCYNAAELFDEKPSIDTIFNQIIEQQKTILENQQKFFCIQNDFNKRLNEMQQSIKIISMHSLQSAGSQYFKTYKPDQRVVELFQDLIYSPRDISLIENDDHLHKKIVNENFRIKKQVEIENQTKKIVTIDFKNLKLAKEIKLDDNPGFCFGTLKGQKNSPTNEDKFYHFNITITRGTEKKTGSCFAIFDGHGGDDASIFCQNNIEPVLIKCFNAFCKEGKDYEIANALKMAFVYLDASFQQTPHKKPGSAALLALAIQGRIFLANLGDSRAIFIPNNPLNCKQLTYDFKASDPYAAHSLAKRGGHVSNLSNVPRALGFLAITRAIGDEMLRDPIKGKPISPSPRITMIDLNVLPKQEHMHLLLCCDGVTDVFSTTFIASALDRIRTKKIKETQENITLSHIVSILAREAVNNQSMDDITIGLIDLNKFIE